MPFLETIPPELRQNNSTPYSRYESVTSSLFILSTHLYEIGEELKPFQNISFKYFETRIRDGQLEFPYQLKDGISNVRLGYLHYHTITPPHFKDLPIGRGK